MQRIRIRTELIGMLNIVMKISKTYADDNVRKCMRVYMGQVNLYKIDENKRIGFLDQLREKLEVVL
ncbi:MAG: hypothetical protein E6686_11405 [Lachnospiraceae bacterium]|nr:hypothetical protein [Lachnospiraceae bacterium]